MPRAIRSVGNTSRETDREFVVAVVLLEQYKPISIQDLVLLVGEELKGYDIDSNVQEFEKEPYFFVLRGVNALAREGYATHKAFDYSITPAGEQWLKPYFEKGYLLK